MAILQPLFDFVFPQFRKPFRPLFFWCETSIFITHAVLWGIYVYGGERMRWGWKKFSFYGFGEGGKYTQNSPFLAFFSSIILRGKKMKLSLIFITSYLHMEFFLIRGRHSVLIEFEKICFYSLIKENRVKFINFERFLKDFLMNFWFLNNFYKFWISFRFF